MESMEIVTKRGHIDGLPAELDWSVGDECATGGRLELVKREWTELDMDETAHRRLAERFEEGTW